MRPMQRPFAMPKYIVGFVFGSRAFAAILLIFFLMARASKASSPSALPYFRPEALTFLRSLAKHNDRAWFQPRKAQFDAELKEPMLAAVRKVTDAMVDFA